MNRITSQLNNGLLTIAIQGSFDLHVFDAFHGAYPDDMRGVSSVVIDLSGTQSVDSSALGMLISVWKLMGSNKDSITIRGANADVMELLEIGQIGQLMNIQ